MRNYIQHITGNISDYDWELLEKITNESKILKGEYLLEEGQMCRYIWYLKKGAVRFFENINGELKTTHFFLAPSMFTTYHSLITNSLSEVTIEATENCTIDILSFEKLKKLYDKSHGLERIGRLMAEHQFILEFDRRRMLLHMDAMQRYKYLETTQPEVFKHFHLKDIATYLGITPVSLSRLRKSRIQLK